MEDKFCVRRNLTFYTLIQHPYPHGPLQPKTLNIPVVCHVREPIAEGYFGIRKFFLRSVLKNNVDRFIAVSKQNARTFDVLDKRR